LAKGKINLPEVKIENETIRQFQAFAPLSVANLIGLRDVTQRTIGLSRMG